jgi:hypothetical protein
MGKMKYDGLWPFKIDTKHLMSSLVAENRYQLADVNIGFIQATIRLFFDAFERVYQYAG